MERERFRLPLIPEHGKMDASHRDDLCHAFKSRCITWECITE